MANKKCHDCSQMKDAGPTKGWPDINLCFECLIDRLYSTVVRDNK